jgi:hypothetical protein
MESEISSTKNPNRKAGRSSRQNVIRHADGKCQMCGRTTLKHGISLLADQNPWAGSGNDGLDALWAVCLDCSVGLRAYLRSLKISAETLRRVSSFRSVHVRIGELLKAFGGARRVPSSLISSVANQPSWKSRLRELRQAPLGWEVAALRYKSPSGRVKCDYMLLREGSLPEKPKRKITSNQEIPRPASVRF